MNTYTHTDNPIDTKEYSLEVVGGLFSDKYLERFKVFHNNSLFPPNFEMLQKNKCIYCSRKLYINQKKTIARCKSKKCQSKFIIRTNILLRLGGSIK